MLRRLAQADARFRSGLSLSQTRVRQSVGRGQRTCTAAKGPTYDTLQVTDCCHATTTSPQPRVIGSLYEERVDGPRL